MQRVQLHRVADADAATLLQGDRFTTTLGTDLLEVTYDVAAVRMRRAATPEIRASATDAGRRCATCSFDAAFYCTAHINNLEYDLYILDS